MAKKLVKVKILAYVGEYSPDQIVEVDEETAAHLCHVNEIDNGTGVVTKSVRAIPMELAQKIDARKVDINDLSAGEAAALGIKNVVDSSKESTMK